MIYLTLFWIGLVGLLAQALLGMGGHGHAGHSHSGQSHAGQGHHNGAGSANRAGDWLLSLLSPLAVFSLCLGIGAAGLLLRFLRVVGPEHLLLALLGGILFYGILVRPLWGLIFRFASDPAKALDGAVAETAEALTHFDATGKGLVRVNVDGQIVRVLAYLEPEERAEAAVEPGDQLTIISVDGRANTCRVAKI